MLKVDLHTHTADDPQDLIPHTAIDLIDRAAALGYEGLAITLHDRQWHDPALVRYARDSGITLIEGIERTIQGGHVLLLNFPAAAAERVCTFRDVAALKRTAPGLVIAPHPFFPSPSCLRGLLAQHAELFDAVEFNYCYTASIDFNRKAGRWAARHRTPLVANSDLHRLWQLGRTYSLVDAEPHPDAICAAIRSGRVEIRSAPLSFAVAARLMATLYLADLGWGGRRAPQPARATLP